MKSVQFKGYLFGIIASISYGLNPLFALPLYSDGFSTDSVLLYRYAFAVVLLGAAMKLRRKSFALKRSEILPAIVMGLLFSLSSFFLFESFNYMDAGVASTILFMYPVIVALIMALCFHEKLGLMKIISIAAAFTGISMLYEGEGGTTLNTTGICLVLLSSLSYALYIVGVNRSTLRAMPSLRLTFYALLFGSSVYIVRLHGLFDLQPLTNAQQWSEAFGLALFPSLISMVTIAKAIRYIGPTPAAILGALEPLTALFVGVMVFDEHLTETNMAGVILILFSVTMLAAGRRGWQLVKATFHKRSANVFFHRVHLRRKFSLKRNKNATHNI